jgi:hypothetical protein
MLYHFLIAVGIIFLLMGIWIIVQAVERRQFFDPSEDCDVLTRRLGCIGCALRGSCKKTGGEAEKTVSNHQ